PGRCAAAGPALLDVLTGMLGAVEELPATRDGSGELMLMLLADARLPTGAHTQSAGLEPAMNAGITVDRVPGYIAARLATVTTVEAGAAVVARQVTTEWASAEETE